MINIEQQKTKNKKITNYKIKSNMGQPRCYEKPWQQTDHKIHEETKQDHEQP